MSDHPCLRCDEPVEVDGANLCDDCLVDSVAKNFGDGAAEFVEERLADRD